MSAQYLEHYLDSIETLPSELSKNFATLQEISLKTRELLRESNNLKKELFSKLRTYTPEQRNEKYRRIVKLGNLTNKLADDKVKLASENYEMVDMHIRRLDSDLLKFRAQDKQKTPEAVVEPEPAPKKRGRKAKKNKKAISEEATGTNTASTVPEAPAPEGAEAQKATVAPLLNMPVDPDEPIYCLCHQVSFGEMVACDNPECLVEWYHFPCVGLIDKPEGDWFCPDCIKK